MSMYTCGGCSEMKDGDFVGCTEGPDGELYCDDCVTELTDKFDQEGEAIQKPRFEITYCSQCGGEFGPGDHGYSHCLSHCIKGAYYRRGNDMTINIDITELMKPEGQRHLMSSLAYISYASNRDRGMTAAQLLKLFPDTGKAMEQKYQREENSNVDQ